MTAPEAGGERFIAVDRYLWMGEIGEVLRERLGEEASKVPTRTVQTCSSRWRFSIPTSALWSAGSASGPALLRRRRGRRSAGATADRGLDRRNRREPDPPRRRAVPPSAAARRLGRLVGEDGDAVTDGLGVDEAHGFLVAHLAEEALAGPSTTGKIFSRSSSTKVVLRLQRAP